MQVSDCISYIRINGGTPGGNNVRWSDANLTTLIDRAVKRTVARVLFPESRLTQTTVINQQEYTLPETHRIYRVYLGGQLLVPIPGNIDTLEGAQILYYDQSGQGTAVTGGGGPPGGGGVAQPQWTIETPVTYPFLNNWGTPSPTAVFWQTGQRPRYYRRGGNIGLVPAPASAVTLTVEGVLVPQTLTTTGSTVIVPDNFMDAIADFVLYRMYGADKDELARTMAGERRQDYDRDVRELLTWKRQYSLDDAKVLPRTYRQSFQFAGNRVGNGSTDF